MWKETTKLIAAIFIALMAIDASKWHWLFIPILLLGAWIAILSGIETYRAGIIGKRSADWYFWTMMFGGAVVATAIQMSSMWWFILWAIAIVICVMLSSLSEENS